VFDAITHAALSRRVQGLPRSTGSPRFNEQVRRNAARFPEDFMFRLSTEEWDSLRPQFAALKTGRGQHRKYLPLARRRPIGFVNPDEKKRG
jgi:ORF6N domain-containing protein